MRKTIKIKVKIETIIRIRPKVGAKLKTRIEPGIWIKLILLISLSDFLEYANLNDIDRKNKV